MAEVVQLRLIEWPLAFRFACRLGGEAMAAQAFSEEHHDSEILSDQPPCRSCGGGGC
jgi:hypothetical protein